MERACLVEHVDIIWLESHDPPGEDSFWILDLHEAFECNVVGDNLEWFSMEKVSEVVNSPDHCEEF